MPQRTPTEPTDDLCDECAHPLSEHIEDEASATAICQHSACLCKLELDDDDDEEEDDEDDDFDDEDFDDEDDDEEEDDDLDDEDPSAI